MLRDGARRLLGEESVAPSRGHPVGGGGANVIGSICCSSFIAST